MHLFRYCYKREKAKIKIIFIFIDKKVKLWYNSKRGVGMYYHSKIREEIKKVVLSSYNHPTAEDVYKQLLHSGFNYSISTVYRNLHLLSKEGIILELVMPNGKIHYDGKILPHHHAYCFNCKTIFDLNLSETLLKEKVGQAIGMDITEYHILVKGICSNCRKQS